LLLTHNHAAGDFQLLRWCLSHIPIFSLTKRNLKLGIYISLQLLWKRQPSADLRILQLYIIIVSSADHFNKSQFVTLVFLYWNIDKDHCWGPCVTSAALVHFTFTQSFALICLPFLWVILLCLNDLFLCQPEAKCHKI
jgi:hypothetical protein